VGDSQAWDSHGGASQAEVLTGARPVEWLSASMAGSVSNEASAWCGRRWRLCRRGTGAGWHCRGPWWLAAQLLGCSRCSGSMVWGRFLLRSARRRRVDGGSFSDWRRSRTTTEWSGSRGGLQRGMSRGESRERGAVQRGETWLLLDEDLATIRP
jgi:hypothetical protein